jgi:SAM-dependent methyltransferase
MIVGAKDIVWSDETIRAFRRSTVLSHGDDSDIARIVELADPSHTEVVLDIVTGLGHVAKALSPFVERIDAIDPDKELIDEAQNQAMKEDLFNIRFSHGDPSAVACSDEIYDIVTARLALRHFGDASKLIKEVGRVLKPGGRLLMADSLAPPHPDLESFLKNLNSLYDKSHIRSYSLAELEIILSRENFDIDLIEIYPKEHDFETWAETQSLSNDTKRMISLMLTSAGEREKRHFRVVEKGRKLVSFVTWMILLRAMPAHMIN